MRTLMCLIGLLSLFHISGDLLAQVGSSENTSGIVMDVEDQNAQRIDDLEEKVKVADALVKRAQRYEKNARRNAREAHAALKAEKKAQKAGKQTDEKARKLAKTQK